MNKNVLRYLSRRDFMKVAAAGGAATAAILACREGANIPSVPSNPNYVLPANDLTGDREKNGNLLPYMAGFIPVASSADWENAFWKRLDTATYFQNNNYSVTFVEDWRTANNVDAVNAAIIGDFTKGRALNPNNDFLNQQNWQSVVSTVGADSGDHWRILNTIGEQGLGQDVKIVGYFDDAMQRPNSNIIRQVFMVENNGRKYIVKVQNINDALNEAGAIVKLELDSPQTKVSSSTIFRLSRSTQNKVAITVSDAIINESGLPAQTLETYVASNALTPVQKNQLLELYRVGVNSVMNTKSQHIYGEDLVKLGNIVVEPGTGDLIVVDAFSSDSMTQVINQQGLIKATNPKVDASLNAMRIYMGKAGITQDELIAIEQGVMNSAPEALSSVVPAGEAAAMNVVDDVGNVVATIPLKNDIGANPIVVPKSIPFSAWDKLTVGINVLALAVGGYVMAREFADKVLSFDEKYEVPMAAFDSHNMRNVPYDTYNYYADGTTAKDAYFLGMTTYTASIDDLKNKLARHRWAMNIKEGFGFPKGNEELQLIIQRLGAGVPVPVAIESRANLDGSQGLKINSKSPIIAEQGGQQVLDLINSDMAEMYIDPAQTPAAQQQFDSLDQVLSDEINLYWPTGQKWHVLDKLKQLYENSQIDFWTLSETGHIIYGYQTGANLEMRYLAYEDSSQSQMYQGNDGKLHYPKKAVTLKELLTI